MAEENYQRHLRNTNKATVLNQLELTSGDKLLNAGEALFSDDLIQDVQMAIFATTERLTFNDIQRYYGPVLKLIEIAEELDVYHL